VTLVLYMDDRHRFVGHAAVAVAVAVAVGWVEAARLSVRPVLLGAQSVPGDGLHPRPLPPLQAAERHGSRAGGLPRAIAASCGHHGLAVADHLVVTARGSSPAFLGGL